MRKFYALLLSLSVIAGSLAPSVYQVHANEVIDSSSTKTKTTEIYKNTDILNTSNKLLYGYLTDQPVKKSKIKIKGETNKKLYPILLEHVKEVASGDKTSTAITVTAAQLGLSGKTWTNQELGLDSLFTADNKLTDETKSKIFEQIGFDLHAVLDALLNACPYDLYWYNKTLGTRTSLSSSVEYSDVESLKLESLTFYFTVSDDYKKGNTEDYKVDSSKITRVNTAKDNANSIVNENAALSDYQKLVNYKQKICDLVSYNTDAATSKSISYGDPWQIISVFDGDSSTNVVCEGYAKAFKYLCDLTTFNSSDIDCILVGGTMDKGNHMWNIVTMEDNKNYLVDVTNCDEGTTGYPDYLFLAGTSSGSPTAGYKLTYTKKKGNDEHTYTTNYQYDEDTLSTYQDDDGGYTSLTLNKVSYKPNSSVHTHKYGEPEFIWSDDKQTCKAVFTCEANDDTKELDAKVNELTNQYVAPTETAEGKRVYQATVTFNEKTYTSEPVSVSVPKLEHTHKYGDPKFEWSDDKQTCQAVFKCTEDEHTEKVVAEVKELTDQYVAPSEKASGKRVYEATVTFNGNKYTDDVTVIVPKLEHTHKYGDPEFKWSADKQTCKAVFTCEANDDTKELDAKVNELTNQYVAPTETIEGKRVYQATVTFNGKTYTSEPVSVSVPKLEHNHKYGDPKFEWSDDKQTCKAVFTCEADDDTKELDTKVSELTEQYVAPSENANGKRVYQATVTFNGKTFTDDASVTIPMLEKETPAVVDNHSNESDNTNTAVNNNQNGTVGLADSAVDNNVTETVVPAIPDSRNSSSPVVNNDQGAPAGLINSAAQKSQNISGKNNVKESSKSPAKVTLKKVKSLKGNKIKITFRKTKRAQYYLISYRIKGKKKWIVKKVKKTSYTIKKLKKNKKYQIRIRAVNGKKRGKWSKIKTVKVK